MAVYVPVVRKYHIGDHVALEAIRAVGAVVGRRGVITGVGPDNGSGRYLVEFRGVTKDIHRELIKHYCRCKAHDAMWRKAGRLLKRKADQSQLQELFMEAERACESRSPGGLGLATSAIWYESRDLLNCSGHERLPLNVTVSYGTPPPFFEQMPMGTWEPSTAARYAHGTHLA